MASTVPITEMRLAYLSSELGEVLDITTSGSSYGTHRDKDKHSVVTAQSLAQIKSHVSSVDPTIVNAAG